MIQRIILAGYYPFEFEINLIYKSKDRGRELYMEILFHQEKKRVPEKWGAQTNRGALRPTVNDVNLPGNYRERVRKWQNLHSLPVFIAYS